MKRYEVITVSGQIVNRPGKGRVDTLDESKQKALNERGDAVDFKELVLEEPGLSKSAKVQLTFVYEVPGKGEKKGGDK